MHVEIDIADDSWRACSNIEQVIETAAAAAASALGEKASGRSLSVRLAGNRDVQALNKQYRGKNKPTNILSFESGEDPSAWPQDEPVPLGDVILAFGVVQSEAADYGKKIESHLSHLIVHGVLHLAGYDHEDAQAADEMEALEIQVLAGLGIENPYD